MVPVSKAYKKSANRKNIRSASPAVYNTAVQELIIYALRAIPDQ